MYLFFPKSSAPESDQLSSLLFYHAQTCSTFNESEVKHQTHPQKCTGRHAQPHVAFLYTELNTGRCTKLHENVLARI